MSLGSCIAGNPRVVNGDDAGGGDFTAAERARQREIASYLIAASVDLQSPRFDPSAGLPPRCSQDPSLTALVQLGALRLDCDRSFLSLIDGTTQYIIAEATRTTPLTKLDATPEESGLYLGVMQLEATWGVCPNTMKVFTDETGGLASETTNITAHRTRYIIRDFQADAHYKTRPYVEGWPFMRSYAEVPIISPLGYVIGGYCVVDNRLRDFGDETVNTLSEIASTIMAHLENLRMKYNQVRSEKLIRGLDTFIQEEVALRESRSILSSQASRNTSYARSSNHGSSSMSQPSRKPEAPPSEAGSSETNNTDNASSIQQSEGNKTDANSISSADRVKASMKPTEESDDMKKAFERSAFLIKEAIGMDGIVFLDACPVGFASRQPLSNSFDLDPFRSTDDDLLDFLPSTKPSPILASSISEPQPEPLSIPEGLLYRMIRRFKQGHVFTADEHGPFEKRSTPMKRDLQGKDEHPVGPVRRDSSGPQDSIELFEYLPQARSIIFLPLWHFQKEKWFAAALGWTSDPTKSFDPGDATYLNAFGNAIMAEILRLETLAVSKAKSDFISSISHELRSPLHGILATSELLSELLKSPEEQKLLEMLRSCGVTLLDTMNHLLDYAKINSLSLTRNSKSKRANQKVKESLEIKEFTDLSELVENVVENVVVGYGFEHSRIETKSDIKPSLVELEITELEQHIPVLITIDIAAKLDWRLKINTGAWRRIVMNLFGNALKYTPSGRIEVKLDIVQQPNGQHIMLCVNDTGIGMDKDYQKYKLFQPFAQENSLSAGTGLGLCIVQQIVQNLGGTIDVQSERGIGTMITVLVPLGRDIAPLPEEYSTLALSLQRLEGLELGFVEKAKLEGEEEAIGTNEALQVYHDTLRSSLSNIAKNWLKMNVKFGSKDDVKADIYVFDNSISFEQIIEMDPSFHPSLVIGGGSSKAISLQTLKLPIGPRKLASALISALDSSQPQIREVEDQIPTIIKSNETISHSNGAISNSNGTISNPTELPTPPEDAADVSIILTSEKSDLPSTTNLSHSVDMTISPPTPKHHVLVVDDNSINIKVLNRLISRIGCTCLAACNGLEAVQLFKASFGTQPFSIVFMDISMPVMDGFTATREIRSFEAEMGVQTGVHIVALTGLGSERSAAEAYSSGMDMFLTKPVSLTDLKKLLILEKVQE